MLKRVKTEIRELGNFITRSPHTEDTTCILGAALAREEFVGEVSVSAWHGPRLRQSYIKPPPRSLSLPESFCAA